MTGHFPKTVSESFLKMVIIDHLKQDVLSLPGPGSIRRGKRAKLTFTKTSGTVIGNRANKLSNS